MAVSTEILRAGIAPYEACIVDTLRAFSGSAFIGSILLIFYFVTFSFGLLFGAWAIITLTQHSNAPTRIRRDRPDSIEIEVTPAMLSAGREAFDQWAARWDYFIDGLPLGGEVERMLASVFRGMSSKRPSLSK